MAHPAETDLGLASEVVVQQVETAWGLSYENTIGGLSGRMLVGDDKLLIREVSGVDSYYDLRFGLDLPYALSIRQSNKGVTVYGNGLKVRDPGRQLLIIEAASEYLEELVGFNYLLAEHSRRKAERRAQVVGMLLKSITAVGIRFGQVVHPTR